MNAQDAIEKWPATVALVEGHALPCEIDDLVAYVTGGKNNATRYFESAAKRARFVLEAKRGGQQAAIDEALTVLRLAGVGIRRTTWQTWFVDLETGSRLGEY